MKTTSRMSCFLVLVHSVCWGLYRKRKRGEENFVCGRRRVRRRVRRRGKEEGREKEEDGEREEDRKRGHEKWVF